MSTNQPDKELEEAQSLCLALFRQPSELLPTGIPKGVPHSLLSRVNLKYLHLDEELAHCGKYPSANLPTSGCSGRRLEDIISNNRFIESLSPWEGADGTWVKGIRFTVTPQQLLRDLIMEEATTHIDSMTESGSILESWKRNTEPTIPLGDIIHTTATLLWNQNLEIPSATDNTRKELIQEQACLTEGSAGGFNAYLTRGLRKIDKALELATEKSNKIIPDHLEILNNLLYEIHQEPRYREFMDLVGREKVYKDLLDAMNPRLSQLHRRGAFTLAELKALVDNAELVGCNKAGSYLHVIEHVNQDSVYHFYVGASFRVINRILQHLHVRNYRKSLHYFVWNQRNIVDFWLLLGNCDDETRNSYSEESFVHLLNIFEMWNGLIFQVFTNALLYRYLPKGAHIRRPGVNLNVASPLIQTYASGAKHHWLSDKEGQDINDIYDELASSVDPLVSAYSRYLRGKFRTLKDLPTQDTGRDDFHIRQTTIARREQLSAERKKHFREPEVNNDEKPQVSTFCLGCIKEGMTTEHQDNSPLYTVLGGLYVARSRNCNRCNINNVLKHHKLHIPTDPCLPFISLRDAPGPTSSGRLRKRREATEELLTRLFSSVEDTADYLGFNDDDLTIQSRDLTASQDHVMVIEESSDLAFNVEDDIEFDDDFAEGLEEHDRADAKGPGGSA